MYTQPPPPNSQQTTQRPSTSPPQPQQQPMRPNVGVAASQAQQNFSGYRPGVRPPTHFVPQGLRPTIPVQQGSTTGIPPGPRLPMAPPSAGPGYQPTSPQQIRPPSGIENILPQMSNQKARSSKTNRPARVYHPNSQPHSSHQLPANNAPQTGQASMQPMYTSMVSQPTPTGQVLNQSHQSQYAQPPQPPLPQQMPASQYPQPPQPPVPQQLPASQYPQPPQPPVPQQPPAMVRPNAPRSRIDPNQIPSPVVVQEQDQHLFDEQSYMTCSKSTIPLASTNFRAIDEGNSNPRFIRLTLYSIPHTEELLQTSHLPLGVILQPLARLRDDEAPIELVDFQDNGPVRCRRCKAYINPYVIFVEGGQKFICNMCLFSNEVPPEYFCNLDMNGRRADIDQRPELKYGTVEFTAPQEYWARPPSPLSYIFAIDVSWNAIKSGMLAKCVETIRDILYNSPNSIPPGGKIGIITFDKDVHFYNLQPQLEQAQMLVVSDVNDVFVPLNSGLLVDPKQSRVVIEGLLESLPAMFAENKIIEPVLGAVIKAVHMALNETGGKLLIFQTALPTFGPGSIRHREDSKLYNTDKERSLFGPQDNYYKTLAVNCVDSGICIDLFLFPNTYIDVATIGLLSCLTGGETYFYPNFDAQRDGEKFVHELKQNFSREFGYNALMRIRCSNGLKVADHFGNFNMRNATDIELAGIDSDKAFGALLKYDGKLDEKTDAYIQCALLYTTSTGQRRVRTHNLSVTVTQLLGNVFRHAEMDTTVNFLAKQAVSNTITKSLRDIRDQLTDKCVKILMSYRRHCASSSSPGQLILPEAFKLFPLYALTMLKSKALRGGANLTSDVRVHCMRLIKSIGVSESIALLYPRLFPVHNLSDQVGYPDQRGIIKLPPLMRVSYARFEENGAYLLENGQVLMFWLGRQVSQDFIRNVFGVESIELLDPKICVLPILENQASVQIRSIIAHLQSQRSKYLRLTIVRTQIDPSEIEFNSLLVEDENNGAMSYVDYLCYIHKQIQTEVSLSD
ncbi:ER to Golgi transport-related protein [Gigaspora margarita]|uniref:ER to Golgi transport-related protein n=1 Tax=Gigaspora margarita TaxID=4874 RepID=A0A8H4AKU9_GIGMA|nr:ER to Golgi transport-related protein [Gigaspora margarita]